jgi:hypothetical protein
VGHNVKLPKSHHICYWWQYISRSTSPHLHYPLHTSHQMPKLYDAMLFSYRKLKKHFALPPRCCISYLIHRTLPIPEATRSKSWVCGCSLAAILGEWLCVSCGCIVLSGRGQCDELFTSQAESYPVWCVLKIMWSRNLIQGVQKPITAHHYNEIKVTHF